jgi:phage terminase small subunit
MLNQKNQMKKLTNEEKISRGTYRKDRDKTTTTSGKSQFDDIPEAPGHLSAQAEAIYYATAESLNKAGNLNAETVQLVADYAYYSEQSMHWQNKSVEIEKKLMQGGSVAIDKAFVDCSRLARQNSSQALKLAARLKILPGDRLPDQEKKRSILDEFLLNI